MSKELPVVPIPSEARPIDKKFLSLPHHRYLFKPPFVARVQGMIGSGKTSWLWSVLNDFYANYFDECVIYCGTKDSAKHWESLPQKAVCVLHDWNPTAFHAYLDKLEADQEERKAKGKRPLNVCIAFDDMIATGIDKSSGGRRSPLEHLILVCRHLNVSIIILTQDSKTGMTPAMRNNCMYHIMYRVQKNDLEKIAVEHANSLTIPEFERMYYSIMDKGSHEFLMINYKAPPEKRFRHGFTSIIKPHHSIEDVEEAEFSAPSD
ncbi:hypothetical protein I8H89_04000 [Candidatus Saccharibacteria bacterium]|nr:hypothetical protein [Candidatus Saccharibacteria bacterium]